MLSTFFHPLAKDFRERIFLSTKIWPSEYENENAVEQTLERLGVEYVDLLYIHQPAGNWLAGYRLLEKVFGKRKLNEIIEQARSFKKSKQRDAR